jgi:hypothetical protein
MLFLSNFLKNYKKCFGSIELHTSVDSEVSSRIEVSAWSTEMIKNYYFLLDTARKVVGVSVSDVCRTCGTTIKRSVGAL